MKANKYDAFEYVKKVLRSCISHQQFMSAKRMVSNHYNLYKDNDLLEELWDIEEYVRPRVAKVHNHKWDIKEIRELRCICVMVRESGGSGWCDIHKTHWV